jgi:hypothetical protein
VQTRRLSGAPEYVTTANWRVGIRRRSIASRHPALSFTATAVLNTGRWRSGRLAELGACAERQPSGVVLGQHRCRKRLRNLQEGAHLSPHLAALGTGAAGHLRVHRDLPQPAPSSFHDRLLQPSRIRATECPSRLATCPSNRGRRRAAAPDQACSCGDYPRVRRVVRVHRNRWAERTARNERSGRRRLRSAPGARGERS